MAAGKKKKGQWGENKGAMTRQECVHVETREVGNVLMHVAQDLQYKKHLGKKIKREAESQAVNNHSLIYQPDNPCFFCRGQKNFFTVFPQENKTVSTSSYFVRRNSSIF